MLTTPQPISPSASSRALPQSDHDLVLAARSGNHAAFTSLVERYERPMIALALTILRNFPDARDAAQESFIAAYRNLHQLLSPEKFGPWSLQITRRTALQLLHARKNHAPLSDHLPDSSTPTALTELSQKLLTLIARLPAPQRHIILLRYLDNLPTPQIALITNRPLGTITKQLSRAHEKLRHWLSQEKK